MIEYRPATGSCARCQGALDMAAVRQDGQWYCSPACAEGEPHAGRRTAVPRARLFGRPHRFFRRRRPKELRSGPR